MATKIKRYFLDTEFIEGLAKRFETQAPIFHLDLISIGLVCEDGREFYAIHKDFRRGLASEWVEENVISKLEDKNTISGSHLWMTRNEIYAGICDFMGLEFIKADANSQEFGWRVKDDEEIEIYAYYADYDWVCFCGIFGGMMELPKGMPRWCRDLKQMMWERGMTTEWKRVACPDPEGAHNALVDAKWNLKLYDLIVRSTELGFAPPMKPVISFPGPQPSAPIGVVQAGEKTIINVVMDDDMKLTVEWPGGCKKIQKVQGRIYAVGADPVAYAGAAPMTVTLDPEGVHVVTDAVISYAEASKQKKLDAIRINVFDGLARAMGETDVNRAAEIAGDVMAGIAKVL